MQVVAIGMALVTHHIHEIRLETAGGPEFFRRILAVRLFDAQCSRAHVHSGGQKDGIFIDDVRLQSAVLRDGPFII